MLLQQAGRPPPPASEDAYGHYRGYRLDACLVCAAQGVGSQFERNKAKNAEVVKIQGDTWGRPPLAGQPHPDLACCGAWIRHSPVRQESPRRGLEELCGVR